MKKSSIVYISKFNYYINIYFQFWCHVEIVQKISTNQMYNTRIFIFWKHDKYIWCCSLSDKWIFTLYFDGALISRFLTIVKVNTFRKGEGCSNYTLYKMYSPVCHIPKKSKYLFSIQDLSPVYFVMVGTTNIVWNQAGWIKIKIQSAQLYSVGEWNKIVVSWKHKS